MSKYENLNFEGFMEIAVNKYDVDQIFAMKIQSNPFGQGGEQSLTVSITCFGNLCTEYGNQENIDGVNYAFRKEWRKYTGTFTLL